MYVRFWGTRGSVPTPGHTTLRYGGNTSCAEVRTADGTLIIFDGGTGAVGLGRALMAANAGPIQGHFLIGHTHWDHIQGLPFFAPLFIPGNRWEMYGPGGLGQQLARGLASQMVYEHFPVSLDDFHADFRFHHLTEGVFDLGSARVTTLYLNHPVCTLGYRLEADGVTLVYATDFEPFSLHPLKAPPGTLPIHPEDRRHIQFLEGADLIIHDAQYTLDDFPAKTGWGHMPIERAVDYAMLARAKQLALFHHDPTRDDDMIDQLLAQAQARAATGGSTLEVCAAAEGQVIELAPRPISLCQGKMPVGTALLSQAPGGNSTVLIVDDDPERVCLLETALHAEGVRVLTAADEDAVLRCVRQTCPTVILLTMPGSGYDSLHLCRTLRTVSEPSWRTVPIMLMAPEASETTLAEAFAAGVTDCITAPIKPTLIRSRVRTWLQRAAVS